MFNEEQRRGMDTADGSSFERGIPNTGPRAMWITDISMQKFKMAHKISRVANGVYHMHQHNFYELLYVVSGDVNIATTEEEVAAGPESLLIVEPGVQHAITAYTDAPYERFTLHFDPQCLSAERRTVLIAGLQSAVSGSNRHAAARVCTDMGKSGVLQLLEAFEALKNSEPEVLDALYSIYIEAILAAVLAKNAQGTVQQETDEQERARRRGSELYRNMVVWLDSHYTQPITLAMLADTFYLSKAYVSSLFKQAMGMTVKDYVKNKRMAHVQMMLAAGIPPAQAASRAGFRSYTTFYRSYLRKFGCSPQRDMGEKQDDGIAQAFQCTFSIRYQQDRQEERARLHIAGKGREDDPMMTDSEKDVVAPETVK